MFCLDRIVLRYSEGKIHFGDSGKIHFGNSGKIHSGKIQFGKSPGSEDPKDPESKRSKRFRI